MKITYYCCYIALLLLSGCATTVNTQTVVETRTPCETEITNQRLFMLVAGEAIQKCINKPANNVCLEAVHTLDFMQTNLELDHSLFRSCLPDFFKTDREGFAETAVELNAFHRKLVEVTKLVKKAEKVGHF